MKKKTLDQLLPNMRLSLLLLVAFAIATLFLGQYRVELAIAEVAVVIILAIYLPITAKKRSAKLLRYIESVASNTESATKDTLLNFPLPVIIFSPDSNLIIWTNSHFTSVTGGRDRFLEVLITDVLPGFSGQWILDGKNECPELLSLGDRRYKVFGSILQSPGEPGSIMAAAYLVDVTDYAATYDDYMGSRLVCAIIMLDNYDELIKNLSEKDKSAVLSAVDEKISAWIADSGGILCKYDRDRYLFLFEDRFLKTFIEQKFSLLDAVRESVKAGGVPATLSIGIGRDGKTFDDNFHYASLGIEMSLSRGGDQAVIKNKFNFEFYGGHSTEIEKRTKVKSRVMANAFGELVSDASTIFVMGHKYTDLDSLGAAVGVCSIARKRGKSAYIVLDIDSTVAENLVNRLRLNPEYKTAFISAQDAMLFADSNSLLVVVDTNRPEQVESEALLLSCNHVAVIDHHRRAATYIDNATLNFHEPYASSACELAVEMMQYLVDPSDILRVEAEALLAGIVLDTKAFTIRTGSRTFDAASFLRRCGADTTEVKRLLQSDFDTTMEKYAIIRRARIYRSGVAIAFSDEPENRVIVAQAADELLNIAGIQASFVISPDGDSVFISARSIGNINVQVIMEKLGGGGNQSTAGSQITGMSIEKVTEKLKTAIDNYLESYTQNTP
jgi:c-di-AMP phosphodiesterase-like protein